LFWKFVASGAAAILKFLTQPLAPLPIIEAFKKDIDRTLIRENLKPSYEEHLLKLM
jgi:hypothetical protein